MSQNATLYYATSHHFMSRKRRYNFMSKKYSFIFSWNSVSHADHITILWLDTVMFLGSE